MVIERRPHERVFHPKGGESRVKQSDRDASDINVIVRKWRATGVAPVGARTPRYGDFSSGIDYHAALNHLNGAQGDFDALPAAVRKHCGNDPGNFLDMVENPERRAELEELGLVPERVPGAPDKEPDPAPEPVPDPS